MSIREEAYKDMLRQRNIHIDYGDKPCPDCAGFGVKGYANTSTWKHGAGGCVMTSDICDKCWGSGNANKPWLNLKTLNRSK